MMNNLRMMALTATVALSMSAMAQKPLTDEQSKGQKALMEQLQIWGMSPSIDAKDNSVCFKKNGVFYWVTFDEGSPVLYTIHRKGLKFDEDRSFKPSCARVACNEVNREHKVKCIYNDKRVEFIAQSYAMNPTDFQGGFLRTLNAFSGVDQTFKNTYEKAYDKWKKDSIENNRPIIPEGAVGISPLKVSEAAFGCFDAEGNAISDFNQPLRKNSCRYIKTRVKVSSTEKGIFKLGMKITSPDGKAMIATKGMEYSSTGNIEIKKAKKEMEAVLSPFGTDKPDFWKAGEYKVAIYDFEKGVQLYTTTFNIL